MSTMHTPAIGTTATIHHTAVSDLSPWQRLPLQRLANFERIDHQFSGHQVWFESAIALRPSNPAFQAHESTLILMSQARDTGLKITLGDAVAEIDFGFISSAPLTLSCLDAQGHCVAMFQADQGTLAETGGQPKIEGVTLDTRGTKTVRIDCRAPFVLTRFWVKQAAA
ncbi:hypothetical protein [Leptolyngbya iicbica]|uniref:Uncharacterized protein n=2 Tax=Cyanophyceae TaxID=3028117 RepID=A0A4Q7E5J9_9CYAN|nr:hypothetical protein [Leptolyngbya sp. LK]RZM77427.1 hypothetical protein DYY88_17505 [Leptolyngbya sp. LK]